MVLRSVTVPLFPSLGSQPHKFTCSALLASVLCDTLCAVNAQPVHKARGRPVFCGIKRRHGAKPYPLASTFCDSILPHKSAVEELQLPQ